MTIQADGMYVSPSQLCGRWCRLGFAALRMLRGFQSSPLTMLRLLGTATILAHYVVAKYTLVHPFLVSDNRWVTAAVGGTGRK